MRRSPRLAGPAPHCRSVGLGRLALALLAAIVLAGTAGAQSTLTWDQASGNWNTADTNWTGAAWTNGSNAVFGGTAGSTITINEAGITANAVEFNVNNQTVAGDPAQSHVMGFISTTATMNVTVGTGLVATMGSFQGPASSTAQGNKIAKLGSGTLNLNGTNNLVVGDTNNNVTSGIDSINGGGTLDVTGGLLYAMPPSATSRAGVTTEIGNSSANNIFNISGGSGHTVHRIKLGSNASFGGNQLNISSTGTVATPTLRYIGNSATIIIGENASSNSVEISNGAIVQMASGGGTSTMDLGTNAGANSNSLTVTGTGSVLNRGSGGSFIWVGNAGNNNTMNVQNGGTVITGRFGVARNGGDNNTATISGIGSLLVTNTTSNAWMQIGGDTAADSDTNGVVVQSGGKWNFTGTGVSREWSVGRQIGDDSNYLRVTGTGSSLNLNFGLPISLGGKASGTALTTGGNSNTLEVLSGGSVTTVTPIYVGASVATSTTASLNNSVQIGNGTGGTATLTVNASATQFNTAAGYDGTYTIPGTSTPVSIQSSSYTVPGSGSLMTQGIFLVDATSSLNLNNGRLVAGDSFGAATAFVSGPGSVNLAGPAYFKVPATSLSATISSAISGSGSLTKEDAGTLILSGTNTYSGDTTILDGELKINSAFLPTTAAVLISGDGFLNLDFSGSNTIGTLYINGAPQPVGTYSTGNLADWIGGTGSLTVTAVPEPAGLALAALGGLAAAVLGRRRRAA